MCACAFARLLRIEISNRRLSELDPIYISLTHVTSNAQVVMLGFHGLVEPFEAAKAINRSAATTAASYSAPAAAAAATSASPNDKNSASVM